MAFPPARRFIAIECWTWYAVCICAVIMRFMSQRLLRETFLTKKIYLDDVIIIFATCTYTIAMADLYIYDGINSHLDYNTLTPDQSNYYGRQLGIVNILTETSVQTTLWSIKASLLCFYYRLTDRIRWNIATTIVAVYVALGYVAVITTLYGGWCRPFSQYLSLNPEVIQCLTWKNYNILQLTFDVSTDLLILCIPVSVVLSANMAWAKKVALISIFCLGLFVVACAVLTKEAVFTDPTGPVWVLWEIREASCAMLVGNLVVCFPLIRTVWESFGERKFTLHLPSFPWRSKTNSEAKFNGPNQEEKSYDESKDGSELGVAEVRNPVPPLKHEIC